MYVLHCNFYSCANRLKQRKKWTRKLGCICSRWTGIYVLIDLWACSQPLNYSICFFSCLANLWLCLPADSSTNSAEGDLLWSQVRNSTLKLWWSYSALTLTISQCTWQLLQDASSLSRFIYPPWRLFRRKSVLLENEPLLLNLTASDKRVTSRKWLNVSFIVL